jgi:rhodanese-related sulfurtransferase
LECKINIALQPRPAAPSESKACFGLFWFRPKQALDSGVRNVSKSFKSTAFERLITMKTISVQELNQRLQSGETQPFLLDVREPHEFSYCHIAGSINLPMQVPARLAELDPARETVVICHHGMRSGQVANFLISRGFTDISNLTGGVEAWAVQVDPAMPRY